MSLPLLKPTYKLKYTGLILPLTPEQLDADIKIEMNSGFSPDTFIIKIYNIDIISELQIKTNNTIEIELGYENSILNKVMTGYITQIYEDNTTDSVIKIIEGIDNVIYQLKHTNINLSFNNPTDAINIVKQICSEVGVGFSTIDNTPSGVLYDTFTIVNETAYNAISKIAKDIGYNVTAKHNQLYITPFIRSSKIASPLVEGMGVSLFQAFNTHDSGYVFIGSGLPSFVPLSNTTVALVEPTAVTGAFVIESVTHQYISKLGYISSGLLIGSRSTLDSIASLQENSFKKFAILISKNITSSIENIKTLNFGEIDKNEENARLATFKVGYLPEDHIGKVNKSTDIDLTSEAFYTRKPISSIFAGNDFGIIVPVYEGMRTLYGHNNKDEQDVNILGFLWKVNDKIPEHDIGEFLIKMKNHSKISMKEDGHGIFQFKGLKIEINTSLGTAKTTPTGDGQLLIDIDGLQLILYDGSKLVIDQGNHSITIDSSGVDVV